jgi:hypothetical protein
MPEDQAGKAVHPRRMRPHTLALWCLCLGLLFSLAANIRQDRKTDALARDLAMLRQESQKQVTVLRDAQSASLEQDLLRLDQLTVQLQKTSEDELHQAATLASRTRAELAKTVEQRHQEMITAISDLRADLRSEENARAGQLNQVEKLDRNAPHTRGESDFSTAPPASNPATPSATLVSAEKDREDQLSPAQAQKKGFWSKLNPFSRNKNKKREAADGGPAQ